MEKILIVDDIDSNRNLLKQLLNLKGFQLVEATNGVEAIESFQQDKPDLILMDIMMPIMDGHEAATKIKSIAGDEHIPIIFITSLSSDESLTETLDSGGDDFVGKPFNFEVIQSKISVHLRIRKLTQQLIKQNQYLNHEHKLVDYFFDNTLKQSFLDKRYINYKSSSLSAFNGDIILSEKGPQGGLYFITGDFTGHGLTASIGILPVSQIFFKMAQKGAAICDIVQEINTQLRKTLPIGMFFAANILQLDPGCSYFSIWTGGLMNGYHFNAKGKEKPLIPSNNLPLGILPSELFNAEPILMTVEKGDQIYFYSDGITESRNKADEMFGEKRLHKALSAHNDNRIEHLTQSLNDFRGDSEQTDDMTIIELTCDIISFEENSNNISNKNITPLIPFQCTFELTDTMIRESNPVNTIIDSICSQNLLSEHKSMIHTLLQELYTNLLDHSILNLDNSIKSNSGQTTSYNSLRKSALEKMNSACITVKVDTYIHEEKPYLKFLIEDNGQEFKTQTSPLADEKLQGSEMTIIKDLCDSINYSNNGRKVEVIYSLINRH